MRPWLSDTSEWLPLKQFSFSGTNFELRRAQASPETISIWESRREELTSLGFSYVRERDGSLAFHHWHRMDPAASLNLQALSFATKSDFVAPSPPGFNFHPYQRAGIEFAWNQKCVLIGDEMGLGKTPQALGVLNLAAEKEGLRNALIVTMATLKINWQREASRWLTFEHDLVIGESKPPADLQSLFKKSGPRILVINVDLLARWRTVLHSLPWDVYIADEAHLLKNPKSARGEVGLSIEARRKIFLTGTPLENHVSEFFHLLHALKPAVFPDFFLYAKQYCDAQLKEVPIPGKRQPGKPTHKKVWDYSGSSNLAELQAKLRGSMMIRRLKSEVAQHLPPKIRQIIELPRKGAMFDDDLGVMKGHTDATDSIRAAVAQAKSLKDRKAFKERVSSIDDCIKVLFEETAAVRKATAVAKIPMIIQHLKDLLAGGSKVLCFAHHHAVLDELMKEFGDQAVLLSGEVSTANGDRQRNIDRFQNDETCRLCVAGIRAAGTGLNLTEANVVVFAELDYVPGILAQAEDRAHRQGQKNSVLIQYLVLELSLDCRMATLLVEKMNMADEALDGEAPTETAESLPELTVPVGEGNTAEALEKEGKTISRKRWGAIQAAIRYLARACDHGRSHDFTGFNVIDAPVGHDLAASPTFSARQAALGMRLLRRYHRQVPAPMMAAAEPTTQEAEMPTQGFFEFSVELTA